MWRTKKDNSMPYHVTDKIKGNFSKLSKKDKKEFQDIFIRNPAGQCSEKDEGILRRMARSLGK